MYHIILCLKTQISIMLMCIASASKLATYTYEVITWVTVETIGVTDAVEDCNSVGHVVALNCLCLSSRCTPLRTLILFNYVQVLILEALNVLVIGSTSRVRLTLRKDGFWTGAVETGPAGSELRLCAEMREQSDIPTTVLLYHVSDYNNHALYAASYRQLIRPIIRQKKQSYKD